MNRRMIAYILGILLLCEAGLMLLPTGVALAYGESVFTSFLATIVKNLIFLSAQTTAKVKKRQESVFQSK